MQEAMHERAREEAEGREGAKRQLEDALKRVKQEREGMASTMREVKHSFGSLRELIGTDREQVRGAIQEVQNQTRQAVSSKSDPIQNCQQNWTSHRADTHNGQTALSTV